MQALTYFEDYTVDIVIATVTATDIDGFTFCNLLRNREDNLQQSYAYLILLAHENQKENIFRNKIEADDFLIKPINSFELKWRMNLARKSLRDKRGLRVDLSQFNVLTRSQFFDFLKEEFNRQVRKDGFIAYIIVLLPSLFSLQRDYGLQWSQWIEHCLLKKTAMGLRNYDRIARISPDQYCIMSRDTSFDELKGLSRRLRVELQDAFYHCTTLKTESFNVMIKGYWIDLQKEDLPDPDQFLDGLWHRIVNDNMDVEDIAGQSVTCFVSDDEEKSSRY